MAPKCDYAGLSGLFCYQKDCWINLVLLATCFLSLSQLSFVYIRRRWFQSRYLGLKPIFNSTNDEGDGEEVGTAAGLDDGTSAPEHFVTTGLSTIPFLELILLVSDIVLGVGLLLDGGEPKKCPLAFTSVAFSAYLLLLLAARIFFHAAVRSHSFTLYVVQWLCTAFIIPVVLAEKRQLGQMAILIHLAIFTTLCLIRCIAPRTPKQANHAHISDSKPGRDETASLLSRLTFFWIVALLWKAFRRTLEASDLYALNRSQASAMLAPQFRSTTTGTRSLIWSILHFFKYDIIKQGVWAVLTGIAVFMPPMLMRLILQYLESRDSNTGTSPWVYVGALLLSGLLACLADGQCNWVGRKMGTKLRTVLISEIYGKVLRKSIAKPPQPKLEDGSNESSEPSSQATDGNILNLISGDVEIISEISASLYLVWITFPVQTTIGTYLLYRLLGISGILGVAFMIAVVFLQLFISKRVMAAQGRVMAASDVRIQASNELLQNIRTIKYCAWEEPFQARVLGKRDVELKRMRSRFLWWSIAMTFFHSLPFIMTAMTLFLYTVVWGKKMGTTVAFPALVIFGLLRIPLSRLAEATSFLLQAHVSLQRIGKFLAEKEIQKYTEVSKNDLSFFGFDDATLIFPTGQFAYDVDESAPATDIPASFQLQNLKIKFQRDALNVIYGPSGSGKSAVLLALLGELDLIGGHVFLPEPGLLDSPGSLQSVAYCPQEAWILNQSIRANILIGQPFIASRYEQVLHAVALIEDLASLDQGDQTLAGENGSRLSGGQKQRVSLARALYSQSEFVLLDDCLSAVDSRTANHIFFHAIKGPLMEGRTCVFATHHTQLAIPHAKHVILLDAGKVKAQGTSEELVAAGFVDAEILKRKTNEASSAASSKQGKSSKISQPTSDINPDSSGSSSGESVPLPKDVETADSENEGDYKESKAEGAVTWPVLKVYLVAMGSIWFWVMVVLGFVVQQLASISTVLWIKQWAFQYDKMEQDISRNKPDKVAAWYHLTIYIAICVSYALLTFGRDLLVFYGALNASSRIYTRLLNAILYAKLRFFDRVPIGQMTNRFSSDVSTMDQQLPTFSISAFQIAVSLLMVVILISTAIPVFLLVAIVIFVAYTTVGRIYISGARDLTRIGAVERSPLYQQLGESLAGYVSIRAYARTWMFTSQNYKLVDRFNKPSLLSAASREWLSFQIGVLSSIVSFTAGAFVLLSANSVSPGTAGLILTYSATFTESVLWLVHVYAIIQQNLNSVERIVEYTKVEQEAILPLKKGSGDAELDSTWPSQGAISFQDYTTRYAPELEPTLKGITFHVKAGSRVAIVGRTGAGKSTLALSLIRGLEASSGSIAIDGIDIASVPLKQLRHAVTVVPQDPKLFDGNLRDNLDPLQQYSDEEMLAVLRVVHLSNGVSENNVLDLETSAAVLSSGQRQLLCIARALLRRSAMLVLDEVTASVDHKTDVAIQTALKESVRAGTTVVTIAHRLVSIADYDRVVVLEAGEVVEQGGIGELLKQKKKGGGSLLRKLCEESGSLEEIEKLAG